jgi:hypothetical protein
MSKHRRRGGAGTGGAAGTQMPYFLSRDNITVILSRTRNGDAAV